MFTVLNSLINTADLRRPPWLSPLSGRSLGRTTCGQARRKAESERPSICSNDQHGIISKLYLSFHSTGFVVSKIQNSPFVSFGPHATSCIGPTSIFGANTSMNAGMRPRSGFVKEVEADALPILVLVSILGDSL